MIRENEAMVFIATLVDRRDMTCDLVALVVPTKVPKQLQRETKK